MKKLLLWLSLLGPLGVFGQGFVNFANTSSTLFTTNGNLLGQGSGNMSGLNQWRIGLYVAPDGTTLESAFTLVAVATNSSIASGRFSYSGNPFAVNPAGPTEGNPIAFQVKAWSLAGGASYEACIVNAFPVFPAQIYYAGKSRIGRVSPATGLNPAPTLFGTGEFAGQLTEGIFLFPIAIPEPSLFALAALGAAAAGLSLRRRTRKVDEARKDTIAWKNFFFGSVCSCLSALSGKPA